MMPPRFLRRALELRRTPTFHTFAVNGIALAFGLVTTVLLARWLGPAGRGEVAAVLLWPALLIYLFGLGLIPSVLYHAASRDPDRVLGTAIAYGLPLSALAMGTGYLLMPTLLARQSAGVIAASRLYLWVIPLGIMSQYCLSVLQAQLRMPAFNALRLVIPGGYMLGAIGLKMAGALTPRGIVALQLWLGVVTLLGALVALWRAGLARGVRIDRALTKPMLAYGIKVHAGNLSQVANLRVDQAFVANGLPAAQLGLYTTAVGAAGIVGILSNAIGTVVTPSIARGHSAAAKADKVRAAFRSYWIGGLAATVCLAAAMPFLIPLVYGPGFKAAVGPAIVLVFATFVLGAKEVLASAALGLGDPWLGSRSEIISAVVTFTLLAALLPVLGIMGAAIASLAAYATQLVVVIHGLTRTHHISFRSLLLATASAEAGVSV